MVSLLVCLSVCFFDDRCGCPFLCSCVCLFLCCVCLRSFVYVCVCLCFRRLVDCLVVLVLVRLFGHLSV